MDFRRANEEFKRLKAQFEAGQLAEAEFKAELRKLMVQDEQGAWWMIGYETERWYRHDGTSWVQADPPIQLPPEATPVESPQPERPERASTERVPPVPAAVGKAAAAPPRRPVIPIAIGAVILLLAAGYFLLQARSPEAEPAATPTQGGDSLIVDKLGITSTPSPAPTLPPTPIRTPVVTASPTPEPSSTPKAELHVSISSSKAFLYKGPDNRYTACSGGSVSGDRPAIAGRSAGPASSLSAIVFTESSRRMRAASSRASERAFSSRAASRSTSRARRPDEYNLPMRRNDDAGEEVATANLGVSVVQFVVPLVVTARGAVPTGVFTDKTFFHHYTRKWDLQSAQSICPHCSLGCNTTAGERSGLLRRITNRFNSQVNGYFLCDRGRFGYEYVNSDKRIKRALMRPALDRAKPAQPEGVSQVLDIIGERLQRARGIVGIGSPRASIEANAALRSLVGPQQFFLGVDEQEHRLLSGILSILRTGPVPSASIHDAEQSDAVFVLGEFLKFLDLPRRRPSLTFELATSVPDDVRKLLRDHGWRQTGSVEISRNADLYREYIRKSRGEFTVARDQYVRPNTGWFSDRTACYLAAGRPVITQETGFSKFLPTGRGLFGFRTMDDILAAVDAIETDYGGNCRAAADIAREYFAAEKVVGSLMQRAGL